ncbi:hypothetical protein UFOVP49_183 [uncultured Caudovirales phage]|uniref:Helix-turn-helix domain containing protein n=1 Tax=uncultured Caudovirales phage TaxID=2100421 RepID=A0A6J5KT83_9CAUD|nr:hypothetical protein UFOVP49_183 [uncultured Caudovirales phage]
MTAINSLFMFLTDNDRVTARQARTMFKVKNIADLVYRLRNSGVAVYTNRSRLSDGTKTFVYRLGEPNKAFMSARGSRHIARSRQALYRNAIAVAA